MKNLFWASCLLWSQMTYAENLLLKADLDPREISMPAGYRLWSDVQARNIMDRPMRQEVMTSAEFFLESKISLTDFTQLLQSWSETGFNERERIVLADTLQKSSMPLTIKNKWLCRIEVERNCPKIKIFPKHLAPILQKFDWLVIDGLAYPRVAWDEILVTDESLNWIFLSARFETYTFNGKWADLKFKNPMVRDWISGTCENYQALPEVESFENHVLLARNCLRTSLVTPKVQTSFYEENKSKLWVVAGVLVGASAIHALAGKSIVLEKPSFK